jgi:class 3 adenylate cyclase
MSGEHHAALAIEAARRLVALGPDQAGGLEFGVGVHTGLAHIGTTVGADEGIADVRAIGDSVNVAARLSSAAAPGEALVSSAAWEAAGESPGGPRVARAPAEGQAEPLQVAVLRSSTREVGAPVA